MPKKVVAENVRGNDEDPILFEVLHGPSVPCRQFPDTKSKKVTIMNKGETVLTYEWDATHNWRRVWVENDAGEMQDAWMQVMSEALGQMLLSLGPMSADPASDGQETDENSCTPSSVSTKRLGRFSQTAAYAGIRHSEEKVPMHNIVTELPAGMKLPPKISKSQLYRVVYDSNIAVRAFPSMTAPALRALKCGALVNLFEWDNARKWRRVTVQAQVDNIDDERGGCKIEHADGWVLVYHPLRGPLLEAVLELPCDGSEPGEGEHVSEGDLVSEVYVSSDDRSNMSAHDSSDDVNNVKPELYKVVFKPRIAVRFSPSIDAPAMRALKFGTLVHLFEWDDTRTWRRVTMPRPVDNETDIRSYHVEEANGWVLLVHPTMGQLLELASEEDTLAVEEVSLELRQRHQMQQPKRLSRVAAMAYEALQAPAQQYNGVAPSDNTLPDDVSDLLFTVKRRTEFLEPLVTHAVRTGSLRVVESVLKSFADPNAVDMRGETALFEAAANAHTDIVARLLICKANVNETNETGMTALMITTDVKTRCLLKRYAGQIVDDYVLHSALLSLDEKDRRRLMSLCDIPEATEILDMQGTQKSEDAVVNKEPIKTELERALENMISEEKVKSSSDEVVQVVPDDSIEKLPSSGSPIFKTGQAENEEALGTKQGIGGCSGDLVVPELGDAGPSAGETNVGSFAAPSSKDADKIMDLPGVHTPDVHIRNPTPDHAENAPVWEELDLDDRGVPRRSEVPTSYRVVWKQVAIRKFPQMQSEQIRAKKCGEIVEMYEWDHTHKWRRVRTKMAVEGEVALIETDGWMLTHSERFGPLLQEIPEDEFENDDCAG